MSICSMPRTSWPMAMSFSASQVSNGIALSKIHHAAFANHLIGIDPDGRVHVSDRLLKLHDGVLEPRTAGSARIGKSAHVKGFGCRPVET
jgi:hypothetical protein